MKTLKTITKTALITLTTVVISGQALADTQVTEQMKQDCFNAHKQLMEKPAVRMVDICWHAHSYMMTR